MQQQGLDNLCKIQHDLHESKGSLLLQKIYETNRTQGLSKMTENHDAPWYCREFCPMRNGNKPCKPFEKTIEECQKRHADMKESDFQPVRFVPQSKESIARNIWMRREEV
jgi:hypothetical protein